MTAFLASVSSLAEAELAHGLGADVVDLKDPRRGALGALDLACVRRVVARLGSDVTLSATIGDLPLHDAALESAICGMREAGVDIVKAGVFGTTIPASATRIISNLAGQGVRIALVFFAENTPVQPDFAALREAGAVAVMLDTRDKASGKPERTSWIREHWRVLWTERGKPGCWPVWRVH